MFRLLFFLFFFVLKIAYVLLFQNFVRELRVLMTLQGLDRFPKVYGVTAPQDGGPLPAIVQEFIGDSQSHRATPLYAAINSKSISKDQSLLMALDIAEGLRDMHRRNWLHCDLKGDNILLQPAGHPSNGDKMAAGGDTSDLTHQAINVKLIDFGFAANMEDDGLYLQLDEERQRSALITSHHIAPEVIRGQMAFYEASEVFSLGLVFKDLSKLGDSFLDLLGNQCMKMNPDDRPDIDDVIDLIQFNIQKMQQSF